MNIDAFIDTNKLPETNLDFFINKKVSDLVKLDEKPLTREEKFRHYAYSLLVMGITEHFWNGNKNGIESNELKYPLNKKGLPKGNESYFGHNICAIAVDFNGKVIDFEFNHNKLYKSSVEHAETRLVKRIYNLSQLQETYKFNDGSFKSKDEANTFDEVSIYTSLESCSQCSGVMALAKVKEIIYLQEDPGMYKIGNILRNLTKKIEKFDNNNLVAPRPISGNLFGFPYKKMLEKGYVKFHDQQSSKTGEPFSYTTEKKYSNSMTSFLCTEAAYNIYQDAKSKLELEKDELVEKIIFNILLDELISKFKKNNSLFNLNVDNVVGEVKTMITQELKEIVLSFKTKNASISESDLFDMKNNSEVIDCVKSFYEYVTKIDTRATPHK